MMKKQNILKSFLVLACTGSGAYSQNTYDMPF